MVSGSNFRSKIHVNFRIIRASFENHFELFFNQNSRIFNEYEGIVVKIIQIF